MALELNRKLNGEATFYTASINNSTLLIQTISLIHLSIHKIKGVRIMELQIYGIHSQVHSRGVGSRGAGG